MSAYQLLKSGVVLVAAGTLAANYVRLREDLAQQLKLVGLLRKELIERERCHHDELAYYKAEMRAMENNMRKAIDDGVAKILIRVAEDRGVRFQQDDSLIDMENALMAGERRQTGQRVTLGSGHTSKPRRSRTKNKPR